MATDLRAAAASARAFADNVGSPELKQSFRAMARRWEAEAERTETHAGATSPCGGRPNAPASANMKDR